MKNLERRLKRAKPGAVYHPKDNSDYGYVVVRADREKDRLWCLILWSRVSHDSKLAAGRLFDEPLSRFEEMLNDGIIKRFAPRPKQGKKGR